MDLLNQYRQELDATDTELVQILARRLDLCRKIAILKRETGVPMMQPHRVEHVKERCARMGAGLGLSPDFVAALYQLIIDEACRLEDLIIDEPAG